MEISFIRCIAIRLYERFHQYIQSCLNGTWSQHMEWSHLCSMYQRRPLVNHRWVSHCGLQVSLRPMSSAIMSMTADRSLSTSWRRCRTWSTRYFKALMLFWRPSPDSAAPDDEVFDTAADVVAETFNILHTFTTWRQRKTSKYVTRDFTPGQTSSGGNFISLITQCCIHHTNCNNGSHGAKRW